MSWIKDYSIEDRLLALDLQQEEDVLKKKITDSWQRWLEKNPDVSFQYQTPIQQDGKSEDDISVKVQILQDMIYAEKLDNDLNGLARESWKNWADRNLNWRKDKKR